VPQSVAANQPTNVLNSCSNRANFPEAVMSGGDCGQVDPQ